MTSRFSPAVFGGSDIGGGLNCSGEGQKYTHPGSDDILFIFYIALAVGISSFVAFCILRPRWKSLYAARKRRLNPEVDLPALPDSFFGWIYALYSVTEEQILASAGLDAFVFLNFFKMAIRLFFIMSILSAVIITPINVKFLGQPFGPPPDNSTDTESASSIPYLLETALKDGDDAAEKPHEEGYLWAYIVFTYFFTLLTLYYLRKETLKVIRIRQDYLGTQSTITDRTFRFSGIPKDLRSEEKIEQLVEKLEIGGVENVTLCREWGELDQLVVERDKVLRKLEGAWSDYRKKADRLEDGTGSVGENERPKIRLRHGFLRLRSRSTDAIDYYEEKLRRLDEQVVAARKKKYPAADLAFVTMDSTASCQMAIRALIDPRPGRLLTQPAPSPQDVMWKNTYAPRSVRRLNSWLITFLIAILSLVWLTIVISLASLVSLCSIQIYLPGVAEYLKSHNTIRTLVQTGLPTLAVTGLNLAVPFLYDFLSYRQGMISRGQIELSIVSKNFFFTFFNVFFVFAVSGSVAQFLPDILDSIDRTSQLPERIARSIMDVSDLYISFILLQGLGLAPLRLLELGGMFQHLRSRFLAKTPRDHAEMRRPAIFSYGYYLPTALLIFILCLVYSIVQKGVIILTAGLVYFVLSYFIYKYQLLYAMDQPQHATGGTWRIISYRIILGLVSFQVVMLGVVGLKRAYISASSVVPLSALTVWCGYYFGRRFSPLTKSIALRSIRADIDSEDAAALDEDFDTPRPSQGLLRRGSTLDEEREKGMKFVNPSLTVHLQAPWIYDDPPPVPGRPEEGEEPQAGTVHSSDSNISLGDTHIWREGNGQR